LLGNSKRNSGITAPNRRTIEKNSHGALRLGDDENALLDSVAAGLVTKTSAQLAAGSIANDVNSVPITVRASCGLPLILATPNAPWTPEFLST